MVKLCGGLFIGMMRGILELRRLYCSYFGGVGHYEHCNCGYLQGYSGEIISEYGRFFYSFRLRKTFLTLIRKYGNPQLRSTGIPLMVSESLCLFSNGGI